MKPTSSCLWSHSKPTTHWPCLWSHSDLACGHIQSQQHGLACDHIPSRQPTDLAHDHTVTLLVITFQANPPMILPVITQWPCLGSHSKWTTQWSCPWSYSDLACDLIPSQQPNDLACDHTVTLLVITFQANNPMILPMNTQQPCLWSHSKWTTQQSCQGLTADRRTWSGAEAKSAKWDSVLSPWTTANTLSATHRQQTIREQLVLGVSRPVNRTVSPQREIQEQQQSGGAGHIVRYSPGLHTTHTSGFTTGLLYVTPHSFWFGWCTALWEGEQRKTRKQLVSHLSWLRFGCGLPSPGQFIQRSGAVVHKGLKTEDSFYFTNLHLRVKYGCFHFVTGGSAVRNLTLKLTPTPSKKPHTVWSNTSVVIMTSSGLCNVWNQIQIHGQSMHHIMPLITVQPKSSMIKTYKGIH